MGRPKQLIIHDGAPLAARAAAAAADAGADPVLVVVGADAPEVTASLAGPTGTIVVPNPEWASGLASSLAAGLRSLSARCACDGVLVMLADQPLVDAASARALLTRFRQGSRIVAAGYAGTVGVPAVFGSEHVAELMQLRGDTGAGAWLRNRMPDVAIVPLEAAAVDLDTPTDVQRLAGREHSH